MDTPISGAPTAARDASAPAPTVRPPSGDEDARLAALRNLRILDTPPDERFDRITRLADAHFGMAVSRVTFVDIDRVWFKSCLGLAATEAPRDVALCSHVILQPRTLVVRDLAADPRFADHPQVAGGPAFRFYAGAPITLPGGVRIGSMCVMDKRPHPEFSDADAAFLADLAALVVHELDHHRELINRDERLMAADAQLAVARGAKKRFLAIVSHELRTPVNVIRGFAEMLLNAPHGPLGDPRYTEYADVVRGATTHLNRLIDRVLNYASAESGELQLHEGVFEVEAALRLCTRPLAVDAAARRVRVAVNVDDDAPKRLFADDVQVMEIMVQLARNAVAASPEGGLVRLCAQRAPDGGVRLAVEDDGPGLSPERLDEVLRAFTQDGDTLTRADGGLGLGLPVAKALVERHGGAFSVRTRAPHGTRVEASFPPHRSRGAA